MKFSLLTIVLLLWILNSFGQYQYQRYWVLLRTEKDGGLSSFKRLKDSVIIRSSTVHDSVAYDRESRLEKKTSIEEEKIYTKRTVSTNRKETIVINKLNSREGFKLVQVPGGNPADNEKVYIGMITDTLKGNPAIIEYPTVTSDTSLTKSNLMALYDRYYFATHRSRFFVGFSYSSMLSYRIISVSDPKFNDYPLLDKREENEQASSGFAFSVPLGFSIRGKNFWSIEPMYMQQGFTSKSSLIDWNTGIPQAAGANRTYKFFFWGAGINYTHNHYKKKANVVTDLGLSVLSLFRYKDETNDVKHRDLSSNPVTANLKRAVFLAKFGLGINYRINDEIAVQVVPTVFYDIIPINKEVLRTNLISFGLPIGIRYLKH